MSIIHCCQLPLISELLRVNARPLIDMLPDGTTFVYTSERAAIDGLKRAVAEGRVDILG